jgi:hypothetical protein
MSAHRRAESSRRVGHHGPGRRRRTTLWRRIATSLRPAVSLGASRRQLGLAAEARELRVVVSALRVEVATLQWQLKTAQAGAAERAQGTSAEREVSRISLVLPLVQAALARDWVPPVEQLPLDLSPDTAHTDIVLGRLPEAPLLDPRVARDHAFLDDLVFQPARATGRHAA